MKVFDANISQEVANILENSIIGVSHFETANNRIVNKFRIFNFFENQEEFRYFKEAVTNFQIIASEPDRIEYGDFQTNLKLAKSIALYLKENKQINPGFIVEPTCGKGNFIIAALSAFQQIDKIVGVEIYKPYTWEAKFNIIDFYLSNPTIKKPEIEIHHFNVFDFDFSRFAKKVKSEILVLGNPPWVTNAKLSSLESNNLPPKSNFKKHNGIDAITGKGNFDIGEYITLMMFEAFQHLPGQLAFLVKNTVVKNVIFDQNLHKFNISDIEKLNIDSKKEFEVSVEASVLSCKLNSEPEFDCNEFDFYNQEKLIRKIGWVNNKFVSNKELYSHCQDIDGVCPFEWRQGIKHDLSMIMELERVNGRFVNGVREEVTLEEDLIYGILKSSDLKQKVINQTRKFTIITQKKIGQGTSYIEHKYPMTFGYLQTHKKYFDLRKSSIYNNKPAFSIFGIGEYSFKPYKVAISGFYKTFTFCLVLPLEDKPIMLDDTCYFVGFESIEFAAYTTILLNSEKTKEFLQSITFADAKRTFTKDILMRIDLHKLATHFSKSALHHEIVLLNDNFKLGLSSDKWDGYIWALKSQPTTGQMDLFASEREIKSNQRMSGFATQRNE